MVLSQWNCIELSNITKKNGQACQIAMPIMSVSLDFLTLSLGKPCLQCMQCISCLYHIELVTLHGSDTY